MKNFGDSDDDYRANLVAIKRELKILLKGISEEQRRYEEILASQTDTGIFDNVNLTIQSLVDLGERIELVSQSFDADNERTLRNLITQRLHDLNNSTADIELSLQDLQSARAELPVIAGTLAARAKAHDALSELERRRHAVNQYALLQDKVVYWTEYVEQVHAEITMHQTLLSKVSLFDDLISQITKITAQEQEAEALRQVTRAELESWEQRIAICKKSLQELDIKVNSLLDLRARAPEIYREIKVDSAVITESQCQRDDRQQRLEVLTAKHDLEKRKALLRKSNFKRATPNPAVAMPRPPSEDGPVL